MLSKLHPPYCELVRVDPDHFRELGGGGSGPPRIPHHGDGFLAQGRVWAIATSTCSAMGGRMRSAQHAHPWSPSLPPSMLFRQQLTRQLLEAAPVGLHQLVNARGGALRQLPNTHVKPTPLAPNETKRLTAAAFLCCTSCCLAYFSWNSTVYDGSVAGKCSAVLGSSAILPCKHACKAPYRAR